MARDTIDQVRERLEDGQRITIVDRRQDASRSKAGGARAVRSDEAQRHIAELNRADHIVIIGCN